MRPRVDATPDDKTQVEHAPSRVAAYKAPRSVEIQTEPLPKSGPGKILKRGLREPHWTGHTRLVH